jgi:UDP-N-acetylglucosamine acyltransferase
MQPSIHPSALVEKGAVLGKNVEVGPFAYIEAGARIGDGCRIGPHVTIYRFVTLGAGCQVHAGAVLGDLPQDLAFTGEDSYVEIGEGTIIREGVTIHRGTKPGTKTSIGKHCMFMANSHAAHNVKTGDRVILANGALLGGYIEIGSNVFLSGNVALHQFIRIGDVAMLGLGSSASKDIPPYCTLHPASMNKIAGLNVVGMRRAGIDASGRAAIKHVFKTLFSRGLGISDALAYLQSDPVAEIPEVRNFIDFVASSERGICVYKPSLKWS